MSKKWPTGGDDFNTCKTIKDRTRLQNTQRHNTRLKGRRRDKIKKKKKEKERSPQVNYV